MGSRQSKPCARCEQPVSSGGYCAQHQHEYGIWRWYRLSIDEYNSMLERQRNRCAICRQLFDGKRPHVDHDHACEHPDKGKECCNRCVRGLLCGNCNHFAGWIEKRMHLLASALEYLGMKIEDAP